MHDTIAWSYDRLTSKEQGAFRQLAVFAGGWTLEAAAVVLARETGETLGLLEGLVAQSLVVRPLTSGQLPARFTMLETIHEFGLQRLAENGEEDEARRRHAAYFVRLVSDLGAFWAPFMPNAQQILDQLEMEHPNLNAALAWQRDAGEVAALLELAGALYFFWQLRGHIREGREWLEWGLSQSTDVPPLAQASAHIAFAGILFQQAEFDRALQLCDASIALFTEAHDAVGVAHACECAITPAYSSRQLDRAAAYIDQAFAALIRVGDRPWVARLVSHLQFLRGAIAFLAGQFATAEQLLTESVEAQRAFVLERGAEFPYACWPLHWLGRAHAVMDRPFLALERHQSALELAQRVHEQSCVIVSLECVGRILAIEGRWQEAALLFGATEAACNQAGYRFWEDYWPWERAHGLPEPWQRSDEPYGHAEQIRVAVEAHGRKVLSPIPDPATADELWAAGRALPLADAIGQALAVSLSPPATPLRPSAASASAAALSFPQLPREGALSLDHDLTFREQEILGLLCQHLTDAEIAQGLSLSKRTVEHHVSSILGKLGVDNRRQAAAVAARNHLV
jgi:DNA-binding CsgD family transcriptional regulator/tetratricopeptide (TPR) repeat protein